MVETEAVTRFKEHARTRLLMALRDAPQAGLEKEPAYEAIRREFEEEQGWPAELDEVEAGPARTPRWRNRLHWVVAELVQSGVLEPSGGSPLFRVTPLGRALLHLPQPFRDTPETRALIEALRTAKTPIRDVLFPRVDRALKPAECGHSRLVIRTTAPGVSGHFGPFSASLGPLSLTQLNHGHFG